jgi:hypothetical protein
MQLRPRSQPRAVLRHVAQSTTAQATPAEQYQRRLAIEGDTAAAAGTPVVLAAPVMTPVVATLAVAAAVAPGVMIVIDCAAFCAPCCCDLTCACGDGCCGDGC